MDIIRHLKAPSLKVDSDIDEILKYNRQLLNLVGIWPLESNAVYLDKIFSFLRIATTCIFCSTMMFLQMITIYTNWGDIAVISEIGCILLGFIVAFLGYLYVLLRRDRFYVVHQLIREFWSAARTQEERDSIVELANHSRICTVIYFLGVLIWTSLSIIGAATITLYNYTTANGTDYNRRLPHDLCCGIYCQMSPNYEILFVIQSLAVLLGGTAAAAFSSTVMTIVMHMAGHFRVIGLRLKAIGRRIASTGKFDSETVDELRSEIKMCVIHHERVLSAFEYVNDLLGPVNLGQFILAGVEICFTGWATLESENNLANIVKFGIFFMLIWLQSSIWCWSGQAIIEESSNIGNVIYHDIPWIALPCYLQRDLIFIIRRTQRHSQLDAMGMQVMNLKKLTEVFNAAMSYVALLRSMKD